MKNSCPIPFKKHNYKFVNIKKKKKKKESKVKEKSKEDQAKIIADEEET